MATKKKKVFYFAARKQISNEEKVMAGSHEQLMKMRESYKEHVKEIEKKKAEDVDKKRKFY